MKVKELKKMYKGTNAEFIYYQGQADKNGEIVTDWEHMTELECGNIDNYDVEAWEAMTEGEYEERTGMDAYTDLTEEEKEQKVVCVVVR